MQGSTFGRMYHAPPYVILPRREVFKENKVKLTVIICKSYKALARHFVYCHADGEMF